MNALAFPTGNCVDCMHFVVCKFAEQWKNVKQDDNHNCGLFQTVIDWKKLGEFMDTNYQKLKLIKAIIYDKEERKEN